MILLYDARYSFVLLRPKSEVNLSTQSAGKWRFVWGNGIYLAGRFYFSGSRKAEDVQIFHGLRLLRMRSLNKI